MAKQRLTTTCEKCGKRLTYRGPGRPRNDGTIAVPWPALCPKCELLEALLIERYAPFTARDREFDNGP